MNRVLLVDDATSRETLQAFLGSQGFSVMTVAGTDEANRALEAAPDFIILRLSTSPSSTATSSLAIDIYAQTLAQRCPRTNIYIVEEDGNLRIFKEPSITRDENRLFWMRRLQRGLRDFPRRITSVRRRSLTPIF